MTGPKFVWEGTREHRQAIEKAQRDRSDIHAAVADQFDVTRAEAKEANFRLLYGN